MDRDGLRRDNAEKGLPDRTDQLTKYICPRR